MRLGGVRVNLREHGRVSAGGVRGQRHTAQRGLVVHVLRPCLHSVVPAWRQEMV
jgi:hypothetical protein